MAPEGKLKRGPRPAVAAVPELIFVDQGSDAEAWLAVCRGLLDRGHEKLRAQVLEKSQAALARRLAKALGSALEIVPGGAKAKSAQASGTGLAPLLLIGSDAEVVSAALMEHVDDMAAILVAPVTERYWKRLPLYLISIPKAGTHLLFKLAEVLGYQEGGPTPENPAGGTWYYVLNTNAHTEAQEFFHDAVQASPFGNRTHPFLRSPALFNYRHPLDILVSEGNYYHRDGKSPLALLLSGLTFEERVRKLADPSWLRGSIRDRVMRFAPWLDSANVVPVSFEEMVGAAGGGSDALLDQLLWSLQIKLHVPGSPSVFRKALSSGRSGPTFREGRIGAWRTTLPADVLSAVRRLPQDFMTAFGYGGATDGNPPDDIEAYRRRPVVISKADFSGTPILVRSGFHGHNVVAFRNRYLAIPMSVGALDLTSLADGELAQFLRADTLNDVLTAATASAVQQAAEAEAAGLESSTAAPAQEGPAVVPPPIPAASEARLASLPELQFTVSDFNIVRCGPIVYGVRHRVGPIDYALGPQTLQATHSGDDLIVGSDTAAVAAEVNLRLVRQLETALAAADKALREALAAVLPAAQAAAETVAGQMVEKSVPALAERLKSDIHTALTGSLLEVQSSLDLFKQQSLADVADTLSVFRGEVLKSNAETTARALQAATLEGSQLIARSVQEARAIADQSVAAVPALVRKDVPKVLEQAYPDLRDRLARDVRQAIAQPLLAEALSKAAEQTRKASETVRKEIQTLVRQEIEKAADVQRAALPADVARLLEEAMPSLIAQITPRVHNDIYSPIAGELHRELTRVLTPQTIEVVNAAVPAAIERENTGGVTPLGPMLGYNLFRRKDALLAVPASLGSVDPREYQLRNRPGVVVAQYRIGARLRIFWRWIRWAYWDGAKI